MTRSVALVSLLALIGVSLISAMWLADGSAKSQQPDRIVVKKPWPNEPVRIVAVKTKRKANLEIGKAFVEDDDWLDDFTITVQNDYHKTVTSMTISMVFSRERGDARSPLAWTF